MPHTRSSLLKTFGPQIATAASTTVSYALVKIAALIALDAPPALYVWQVGLALEAWATPNRPTAAGARALALLAREQERIPAARVESHLAAQASPSVPDGPAPANDGSR